MCLGLAILVVAEIVVGLGLFRYAAPSFGSFAIFSGVGRGCLCHRLMLELSLRQGRNRRSRSRVAQR